MSVATCATDSLGATVERQVTVTVAGSNGDPSRADATLKLEEDGPTATFDLATLGDEVDNDDDGTTLVKSVTGPWAGTADIDGTVLPFATRGRMTESLVSGERRELAPKLTARDGDGGRGDSTVTVVLIGANDQPRFEAPACDFEVAENSTTVGAISATDVTVGDVLTYKITGGADAGLLALDDQTGL